MTKDILGCQHTVDLIENGSNIIVDDSNKRLYVKLVANTIMVDDIKEQT